MRQHCIVLKFDHRTRCLAAGEFIRRVAVRSGPDRKPLSRIHCCAACGAARPVVRRNRDHLCRATRAESPSHSSDRTNAEPMPLPRRPGKTTIAASHGYSSGRVSSSWSMRCTHPSGSSSSRANQLLSTRPGSAWPPNARARYSSVRPPETPAQNSRYTSPATKGKC